MSGGEDLSWIRDGAHWPNRSHSRFVRAAGVDWHVQRMGGGPELVLLHGTGASTHSWAGLAPRLADHFTVTAMDLPGHGFTSPAPYRKTSLEGYAWLIADLLGELDIRPAFIVGHSAGCAIAVRMSLDDRAAPRRIIGLNPALLPFSGIARHTFPLIAKLLFVNPFAPRLLSWQARDGARVRRLIASTGSDIGRHGLEFYQRLFESPRHVDAALSMMANWDLERLHRDLARLNCPLSMLVASRDRMVSPDAARTVQRVVPNASVIPLPGLGHLAHEEDAACVARHIAQEAASPHAATAAHAPDPSPPS